MAQTLELKTRGLSLTDNVLLAPGGAMNMAKNIIMDRDDTYRARRGMPLSTYGFGASYTIDSITNYSIGKYASGFLGTDTNSPRMLSRASNTSAWVAPTANSPFSNAVYSFGPLNAGSPMRFAEANRNLYITTWQGIQRIDALGAAGQLAGMARALDCAPVMTSRTAAGAGTYNTGFLQPDTACAYRVVWGYKDRNGAIVLGPPSGRATVRNQRFVARLQKAATYSIVDLNGTYATAIPDFSQTLVAGDFIDISPSNANNTAPTLKTIVTGAGGQTTGAGQVYYTLDSANAASPSWSSGYSLSFGMRPTTVSFAVPEDFLTPSYDGQFFVRVYRSKLSATADSEPSDEMYLCYEANKFTGAAVNGLVPVSFTDITPDALLGEALYTSPTQEGILQSNYMPPACEDMALFAGSLFFANTRQVPRFSFQILSVGGTTGIQLGELLYVGNESYTAGAGISGTYGLGATYKLYTDASLSQQQQLRLTAQSLVQAVNSYSKIVRAYYISGPTDAAGKVMFESLNPGWVKTTGGYDNLTYGFGIAYSTTKTCFIPNLTVSTGQTYSSVSRNSSGMTTYFSASSTLKTGDYVQIVSSTNLTNFPVGLKKVVDASPGIYFVVYEPYMASSFASATGAYYSGSVRGDDEARQNRLHFSKTGIPEAVPLLNYIDIGSANYSIRRIMTVGNSLFVFKDDGLFRVTGYDTASLQVEPFDPTVRLVAPNSLAKLANAIYAWTNQGVVAINESGVSVISRPVDAALQPAALVAANAFAAGVGYESERLYLLGLADTVYVYNMLSQSWTTWEFTNVRAGLVDDQTDKLLLSQSNSTALREERKTRTSADFYDASASFTGSSLSLGLSALGYYTGTVQVSVSNLPVGTLFQGTVNTSGEAFSLWVIAMTVTANEYVVLLKASQYTANLASNFVANGATGTYYTPVPIEAQWEVMTAQAPQATKHWRTFSFMSENNDFGYMRAEFQSDLSKVSESRTLVSADVVSTSGSPPTRGTSHSVSIPRIAQRASRLVCKLKHLFALVEFYSLGVSLTLDGYESEAKVRRG